MFGDGVWEGLWLYNGKFVFIDDYFDCLFVGVKVLDMDIGKICQEFIDVFYVIVEVNGMIDGVYVCLMVICGFKKMLYQDLRFSLWGLIIVIIVEYKLQDLILVEQGIKLFMVYV